MVAKQQKPQITFGTGDLMVQWKSVLPTATLLPTHPTTSSPLPFTPVVFFQLLTSVQVHSNNTLDVDSGFFTAVLLSTLEIAFQLRQLAPNDVAMTCWSVDFQLSSFPACGSCWTSFDIGAYHITSQSVPPRLEPQSILLWWMILF